MPLWLLLWLVRHQPPQLLCIVLNLIPTVLTVLVHSFLLFPSLQHLVQSFPRAQLSLGHHIRKSIQLVGFKYTPKSSES